MNMKSALFFTVFFILDAVYSEKDVCFMKMVDGKLQKFGRGCKGTSSITNKLDAIPGFIRLPNGFWYKLFKVKRSYDNAKKECAKYGARLAATGLRDPKFIQDVRNIIKTSEGLPVWIGLNDRMQEGMWMWEDGIAMDKDYPEWHMNQPDNSGSQNCAYYSKRYNWQLDDRACKHPHFFICERPG